MRVGILEPYRFSPEAVAELRKIGSVKLFNGGEASRFLRDKDVIFIRLKYYLGKDMLESAKRLKYVCSPTTGLNHIDLAAAKRKGAKVISLRGERKFLAGVRATPEHTVGLVLALLRNYKGAFLSNANAQWNRDAAIGTEVYGQRIGIIGFGRVGRLLAKYFKSFGAQVRFYDTDRRARSVHGARRTGSLKELIRQTNIVILCASANRENANLVDRPCLDLLKGKYFVNISRGDLIDEEYLIRKIAQGHFKGVALDVIQDETQIARSNLRKFLSAGQKQNLILTPHIGGATRESMAKTEQFIVGKLRKALKGR